MTRALVVAALLAGGCSADSDPVVDPDPGDQVTDFSLMDMNDTSPRFGESVSPRDYLGGLSAWYFGHAT